MTAKYLFIILVSLIIAFNWGCSGPAQMQKGATPGQNQQSDAQIRLNEDFDPLSLTDEPDVRTVSEAESADFYKLSDFLINEKQDTTEVNEIVPGYRVQLISTRSESESNMVKLDAMLTFQTHVYRIFDDPYYKIRIGDCLSRFEANDLQEIAVKRGFSEAWVVQTNVYRNPGPAVENK